MELIALLLLFITYWLRPSGGSPCSLMATATTNHNGRNHKVELQLQCGGSMCRSFGCNDVREELNITCTGENCIKMKTFSVCDTSQDICVAPERVNCAKTYKTLSQPSSCTPIAVTPTAVTEPSSLSQLSECTTVTLTTTAITEPSPTPQCNVFSRTETVLLINTEVITATLFASASTCFCSKSVHNTQPQLNMNTVPNQLPPALGALLGLIIVALAVVTTGWVWTCWMMKKRGGMKITSQIVEKSFMNPTYADVSEIQQSLNGDKHQQFHDTGGPIYVTASKLTNKRNTTTCSSMNANAVVGSNSQVHYHQQELQDVENNYYFLGKEESSMYNVIEKSAEINNDYADPDEEGEGWGQEENVYHVLEGPAMEGEGPIQDEVTVYEVPVPLRPPKNV